MQLYLDTADRDAAESLLATGLFAGVTTNPTILQRASKGLADVADIYRWAIDAGAGEVFFQAWGEGTATLIERGQRLRDLGPEVVVKFVATRAGSAACAALAARHVPTLLTAIYDPGQAIVAAAAGPPTSRPTWDGSTTPAVKASPRCWPCTSCWPRRAAPPRCWSQAPSRSAETSASRPASWNLRASSCSASRSATSTG